MSMDPVELELALAQVPHLVERIEALEKRIEDNDRPDSVEVPASVKTGPGWKCYGNARRPDEFATLIENMKGLAILAAGGAPLPPVEVK